MGRNKEYLHKLSYTDYTDCMALLLHVILRLKIDPVAQPTYLSAFGQIIAQNFCILQPVSLYVNLCWPQTFNLTSSLINLIKVYNLSTHWLKSMLHQPQMCTSIGQNISQASWACRAILNLTLKEIGLYLHNRLYVETWQMHPKKK